VQLERVVPYRLAREHAVVQAAEQTQRRVPGRIVADDPRDGGIDGEAAAQIRVERRAALALEGLCLEDFALVQSAGRPAPSSSTSSFP